MKKLSLLLTWITALSLLAPAQNIPPNITAVGPDRVITYPETETTVGVTATIQTGTPSYTWSRFQIPGQRRAKVGVIGSSSAAGYGVPYASSWAGKLQTWLKGNGLADTLINLAVPGYNVYNGMPSSYIGPQPWYQPDTAHNITALLKRGCTIIISSFTSNEYDVLSVSDVVNCYKLQWDSARAAGATFYVTSCIVRPSFSSAANLNMLNINTALKAEFGAYYIDMYNPVVKQGTYTFIPAYDAGDGIHMNAAGQDVQFENFKAENVTKWYASKPDNPILIESPSKANTSISNLTETGTFKFMVSVRDGVNMASSRIVTITVNAAPFRRTYFLKKTTTIYH